MDKPAGHGADPFHFDKKPIHMPVVRVIEKAFGIKPMDETEEEKAVKEAAKPAPAQGDPIGVLAVWFQACVCQSTRGLWRVAMMACAVADPLFVKEDLCFGVCFLLCWLAFLPSCIGGLREEGRP